MLSKSETRDLYRKRARRYDLQVALFKLAGFRMDAYRRQTVAALELHDGDTVVEIGCGTGLNFPLLQAAVGPAGRIIGVDLTDSMLREAEARVCREGWSNVELTQCDATRYEFPSGVDGVLSTLAITLIPEYDSIIEHAAAALSPGGRVAILDMKEPQRWPHWIVQLAVFVTRPYGVSLDLADRHPWESVRRYLREVSFHEIYRGALFLSVGEKEHVVASEDHS